MLVSDWIEIKKTGEINCRYIPYITLNISTYLFVFLILKGYKETEILQQIQIFLSFQPDDVNLWYFKLRLFGLTVFIVFEISKEYDFGD